MERNGTAMLRHAYSSAWQALTYAWGATCSAGPKAGPVPGIEAHEHPLDPDRSEKKQPTLQTSCEDPCLMYGLYGNNKTHLQHKEQCSELINQIDNGSNH